MQSDYNLIYNPGDAAVTIYHILLTLVFQSFSFLYCKKKKILYNNYMARITLP